MKSPFGNSTKAQKIIALFVLIAIIAWATVAHSANNSYLQLSAGTTLVRGQTPALDLRIVWPTAGPKDSGFQVGTSLLGDSYFRKNNPHQMVWYANLYDGFGRFDIGLGPAWLQNIDSYNCAHVNYNLLLAYRFKRWPITPMLMHISSAGTCEGNIGRDMFFIGWRF